LRSHLDPGNKDAKKEWAKGHNKDGKMQIRGKEDAKKMQGRCKEDAKTMQRRCKDDAKEDAKVMQRVEVKSYQTRIYFSNAFLPPLIQKG
jgi:hypothetical protein